MTRILIEALWTREDCNCLIWSWNLQIFPASHKFSMDRDWVIHVRLCHLCPALWPLLQVHPERTAGSKHISLSSTSHSGTQALLLLNWHLWPGAQILLSHSLSYLNELCICQIHISLSMSTLTVLWELWHPRYRGQLLQGSHMQQAPVPCSTSMAFISEAALWLPWLQCGSQHIHSPQDCGCRDMPSLRSHRWAAPRCAALTPLGQARTF